VAKSKSIREYDEKRDFSKTPEPESGSGDRDAKHVFVVHRHEATRLHYDLRLGMEGVLRSWAVPKGFTYEAGAKHLAVRTEDHPIEYYDFEGVIPKGQYGAGTMQIWDRGTYEVVKEPTPEAAVENGELKFILRGRRLRGEWHMVRTKQGGEKQEHWLLFKARDRYLRAKDEPTWIPDYHAATEAPFPERTRRMKPTPGGEVFSDSAWVFEMAFAGERVQIKKRGDTIDVLGRRSRNLTERLPGIVANLARLRAENAVIDGVLVALDDNERPDAEALARRLESGDTSDVVLYVFDLCYIEEFDVRALPLTERKGMLRACLPNLPRVLYVDHVPASGERLADAVADSGLGGLIAKRAASPYRAGRSKDWVEITVEASEKSEGLDLSASLDKRSESAVSKFVISNPDKVYWPQEGITKGDLVAYYQQIAEILLPYLHDRPVHMLRYPDGIYGKSFYQRNAPTHLPEWIDRLVIPARTRDKIHEHMIINSRDALLYLVNLGSIDLHPWMSRRPTIDNPDWAVLDLDPKLAPFHSVIRIARTIGKLLRGIGLRPYLKTSGKTGLHIYVPLIPGYTYDQSRLFCETIARIVAKQHKDIATVERDMSARGNRVYIDFMQNRRGQTVVPPYVVRPVEGATVSMPLDWDELDRELSISMFTMINAWERISRTGDLFRGVLDDRQDLGPAIANLELYLEARGG